MRSAASFGVAVLCHAGLFGIGALASRHAAAPDESDEVEVDIVAAKPDRILESPPAAERQAALPRPATRLRARPHPVTSLPAAPNAEAPAIEPAPKMQDVSPAPAIAAKPATAPTRAATPGGVGSLLIAKPRYRSNPTPDYPLASLRRHEEGTVLLSVQVEPDGRPSSISLRQSSGHPLLDEAALEAVRRWTFEPALAAGTPVSSLAIVPVRFSTADR